MAQSTTKAKSKARPKRAAEGGASKIADAAPAGASGMADAALAAKEALAGSRAAGRAVALAAGKARVPLVAGAGLAAGAAGGLALVRRSRGRRRRATLDRERLLSAARLAGSLGEEVARVASAVEKAAPKAR